MFSRRNIQFHYHNYIVSAHIVLFDIKSVLEYTQAPFRSIVPEPRLLSGNPCYT